MPTHRRQGALRQLMTRDARRTRGSATSRSPCCGRSRDRSTSVLATDCRPSLPSIDLERERASLLSAAEPARARRLIDGRRGAELVPAHLRADRPQIPGFYTRTDTWWDIEVARRLQVGTTRHRSKLLRRPRDGRQARRVRDVPRTSRLGELRPGQRAERPGDHGRRRRRTARDVALHLRHRSDQAHHDTQRQRRRAAAADGRGAAPREHANARRTVAARRSMSSPRSSGAAMRQTASVVLDINDDVPARRGRSLPADDEWRHGAASSARPTPRTSPSTQPISARSTWAASPCAISRAPVGPRS